MSSDKPMTHPASSDSRQVLGASGLEVIKVLEERLTIAKSVVETGGALRLRKLVHSDVTDVTEPLALESLDVKRVSVGREVDAAIPIRYEGNTTIFPILEERLITRKQLVLVEEVHVTKTNQVDHSSHEVNLRREEIIVERLDPATGLWSVLNPEDAPPA